jgi:hypothetical protein
MSLYLFWTNKHFIDFHWYSMFWWIPDWFRLLLWIIVFLTIFFTTQRTKCKIQKKFQITHKYQIKSQTFDFVLIVFMNSPQSPFLSRIHLCRPHPFWIGCVINGPLICRMTILQLHCDVCFRMWRTIWFVHLASCLQQVFECFLGMDLVAWLWKCVSSLFMEHEMITRTIFSPTW